MNDNVTSEVDAHICRTKAEKHMLYGELVGVTECITLQTKCHTCRGRYNTIQLQYEISY
jgi:hypothetical protein